MRGGGVSTAVKHRQPLGRFPAAGFRNAGAQRVVNGLGIGGTHRSGRGRSEPSSFQQWLAYNLCPREPPRSLNKSYSGRISSLSFIPDAFFIMLPLRMRPRESNTDFPSNDAQKEVAWVGVFAAQRASFALSFPCGTQSRPAPWVHHSQI